MAGSCRVQSRSSVSDPIDFEGNVLDPCDDYKDYNPPVKCPSYVTFGNPEKSLDILPLKVCQSIRETVTAELG